MMKGVEDNIQDLSKITALEFPELIGNQTQTCSRPAEKTVSISIEEEEDVYLDTSEISSQNQHGQSIIPSSKKRPQPARLENCINRISTTTNGGISEEHYKRIRIEPEQEALIQKQVIEFLEGRGDTDDEDTENENSVNMTKSCCSNCLCLREEIKRLKAELEIAKINAMPVANQSVMDYFQAVLNKEKEMINSSNYKNDRPNMMETICPAPPQQQQIQLVKDSPLFLETNILLECLSSAREDPQQLLRNLIRATFTPSQLMDAGGLGLRRGHSTKPPLDKSVCQTLKTYIMNWCYKVGKSVPKERDMNRCFADTITYARRQASRKEKETDKVAYSETIS